MVMNKKLTVDGLEFPLIYCNGDSYSDENYHTTLKGQTYAHVVNKHFGGYVINRAIKGSCNRRIIRTSIHDLIQQRQINPAQKIIALIGLSFELRSELWEENTTATHAQESQFCTHIFTETNNWRKLLLDGMDISDKKQPSRADKTFFDKYSQGRAYYYSPYAERVNLLCDCVMFQSLMKTLDIEFLMFQSPKAEKLESEYLVDFFKSQLNPHSFFDFENFGFVDWCHQQDFEPLDFLDRPEIGHPTAIAHRAFAEQILIPHFEKSNETN
jgi:hypothetical protein